MPRILGETKMQNSFQSNVDGDQFQEGIGGDQGSRDTQSILPGNVPGQTNGEGNDEYVQKLMKELSSLQVNGQQPLGSAQGWHQQGYLYDGIYSPVANMGVSQHAQPPIDLAQHAQLPVDLSAQYARLSGGHMPPHHFPARTSHRESLDTVLSTSSVHSDRLSQNAAYGQSVLQAQIPYQNFQALHTEAPAGHIQQQNIGMNRSQHHGYGQGSGQKGSGPRIFCGHVPKEVTEDLVKAHFSQWGTVTDVYFPRHKKTLKRRPFCFVTFGNIECANRALQESPLNICGIPIKNMTMVEDRDKYYHEKHARARETLASVLKASPIIAGSNLTQEQVDNIAALLAMDGASAETVLHSLGFQHDQFAKQAPPQDQSNALLQKLQTMASVPGMDGGIGSTPQWPPMRPSSLDAQGVSLAGMANADQIPAPSTFPELSNDAALQNALGIALGRQSKPVPQSVQQEDPVKGVTTSSGLLKQPQVSNLSLPTNTKYTVAPENRWMEPDGGEKTTQKPTTTVRRSI